MVANVYYFETNLNYQNINVYKIVNEDIFKLSNVYLTCHGLDTVGFIVLNGVFLGNVRNSFVRYKFNVKDILRPNGNQIQIIFESALIYAQREYLRTMMKQYVIPPVCPPQSQQGDCHVNFVRKMQSSFSWDWVIILSTFFIKSDKKI